MAPPRRPSLKYFGMLALGLLAVYWLALGGMFLGEEDDYGPGARDWHTVPYIGFRPDGARAPEEKFTDTGMLTAERPVPGVQWNGMISAALAKDIDPLQYFTPIDRIDNLVKRAVNNELILLVSGISYKDVLLNFIWILEKRFGIYNYGIACMDEAMCTWLTTVGKRDIAYRMDESRLQLAYQLLQAGIDVVMTDSDAIWTKNPLPHLRVADITGQRDRHPNELYQTWGSTFCTGLLRIKSTPMTTRFLAAFIAMLNPSVKYLDQRTFNQAMDRGGIDWLGKELDHSFEGSKLIDRGVLRKFADTSVALLPQDPYRRLCSEKQGPAMQLTAAVLHCTGAKKIGNTKVDALKVFRLWVLPDDWEAQLDKTRSTPRRMFNREPWVDIIDQIRSGAVSGRSGANAAARASDANDAGEGEDRSDDEAQEAAAIDLSDSRLWKRVVSEDGRPYWFHLVTRETRWTKPYGVA